jgi:CheY-like chemotaxis protein
MPLRLARRTRWRRNSLWTSPCPTRLFSWMQSGQEPDEAFSSHQGPAAAGCHILLVEDHEATAVITTRLLRSVGHRVTIADCVRCAVQKFDDEHVGLLISDLGLPDGSGHELIRQLLAKRPIKGIALSGSGMEKDIQQSIQAGFMEHLVKPINPQQLEDALSRVLGRGISE